MVTKGSQLGILLSSGTLVPIQANYNVSSFTGIDVATTGTPYTVQFTNTDTIAATGGTLFSNIYNRRTDLISNKTLAANDPTLVGYWDMTPNSA